MEGHTPNEAGNGALTGEQGVRAHCLRKILIGILPFHCSRAMCLCLTLGWLEVWGGEDVIPLYNKFLATNGDCDFRKSADCRGYASPCAVKVTGKGSRPSKPLCLRTLVVMWPWTSNWASARPFFLG
jgi:hypothetical protein